MSSAPAPTITPDVRIAGILAPLFALRSSQDLGVGDLGCLRELVDWAAESGFRLVQLLPINETGADNSPYMAVSSAAIEPSTLEITPERVPGLTPEAIAGVLGKVNLDVLRKGPVAYSLVKPLKLRLLDLAFDNFSATALSKNTRQARAFRAWVAEQSAWIEGYGMFRVLMDENSVNERWDLWPVEQRTLAGARAWLDRQPGGARRRIERRMRFYKWVQWVAFSQWEEAGTYAAGRGVSLMGDVPFGVSYYSSDVFSQPEIFDLDWSGGAPPEPAFRDDPFVAKWGQNWGVPLYRWDRLRQTDFAWWRQRVRLTRKMFHLFRIDHVLGFYRFYGFPWRPQQDAEFVALSHDEARLKTGGRLPRFFARDDSTDENRELNRRDGEEVLRALLQETGEYRLIGEDLGTVPPYVRPSLDIPQDRRIQDSDLGDEMGRLAHRRRRLPKAFAGDLCHARPRVVARLVGAPLPHSPDGRPGAGGGMGPTGEAGGLRAPATPGTGAVERQAAPGPAGGALSQQCVDRRLHGHRFLRKRPALQRPGRGGGIELERAPAVRGGHVAAGAGPARPGGGGEGDIARNRQSQRRMRI